MKFTPPSIAKTAFNCPHCGALTHQTWFDTAVSRIENEKRIPVIVPKDKEFHLSADKYKEKEERKRISERIAKLQRGVPFFDVETWHNDCKTMLNCHVSVCYNCTELSIWVYDQMIYPKIGTAPTPNPDLPEDIRNDYNEASAILDLSPRGSAALIRLAIQKLCIHLGEKGSNINKDIGELVKKGLNPQVQQALDAVRVIGNNAVHPGKIDLKDDRATAETLFRLLNIVAERMISEPKHIQQIYDSLPEESRKQIDNRDNGKKSTT